MEKDLEKRREKNRLNSKKYYEKNRDDILAKKKNYYLKLKLSKQKIETNLIEEEPKIEEPIINKKTKL